MNYEAGRVLVVAWDGADWDLMAPLLEAGGLEAVGKLVERGVYGRLQTLVPIDPALLWTSAITGLPPEVHGVLRETEPVPDGCGVRPASPASRRVPALWEIAGAAGRQCLVIGWPGTAPVEAHAGVRMISPEFDRPVSTDPQAPWPLAEGSVFPQAWAEDLSELRFHPGEFQQSDLAPLVADISQIDPAVDDRPLRLAASLARAVSTQAAATYYLENEPWDLAAVYFPPLATICREFLSYHPPQLPQVSAADFARYSPVVAAAYRLLDEMLGRLIGLAGTDATVILVSASGFDGSHLRPAAAPEAHVASGSVVRPAGFVVLGGPGIRADELLYGARLTDLFATVLWRLGLPAPAWRGSEPWCQAWAEPGPGPQKASPEPLPALLTDLPELPSGAAPEAVLALQEQRFHLAMRHMEAGRPRLAYPLLERMCAERPERLGPALQLIACLRMLGRPDEASKLLEKIAARPEGGVRPRDGRPARFQPGFALMRGLLAMDFQRVDEARVHFERALAENPQHPEMHLHLSRVLRRLGDRAKAEEALRRALVIDPELADAHFELARLLYRTRRFAEACGHAMEAAARRPWLPAGHLVLGLALAREGQVDNAISALRHALRHAPQSRFIHRALLRLHRPRAKESFADAAAVRWHGWMSKARNSK